MLLRRITEVGTGASSSSEKSVKSRSESSILQPLRSVDEALWLERCRKWQGSKEEESKS